MTTQLEQCSNCGRTIGNMEPAHVWQDRTVCGICHGKLSFAGIGQPRAVLPYAIPAPPRKPSRKDIICPNPNCGYRGPGLRKRKGSCIIMIGLLLLGVLPAILYAAFFDGSRVICPNCGMQIRDE